MPPSRHPALRFLGGAQTVTGSRYLVETPSERLLVDCGMFQGLKKHRRQNWAPFPVEPERIAAVVLTHAHIDHSGYLPALVRDGFRGPIVCTWDTAELLRILLADAAHLQEEEARFANRSGYSKHSPALPLFTSTDAANVLPQLDPHDFGEKIELFGSQVELRWAGHILGAASVLITLDDSQSTRVFFSGDVGRPSHPLFERAEAPPRADVFVIESTYGDRLHPSLDDEATRFADAITEAAAQGGMIVIPAFAVDRTEVVLHMLHRLEGEGRIPRLPIYVDSPMALDVLELYRAALARGGTGIRPSATGADPFDTARVTECRSVDESKELARLTYPSVIISASGMATGGRVLHHLARLLPNAENAVILSGFQADGTRGRRLSDGERAVKMLGRYVPVRARVETIESFSVHADQRELVDWLGTAPSPPGCCYLVHGSESAATTLRDALDDELGWLAVVARPMERVLVD